MLVIGLTGGIGSGKSTAAARFAKHGVPVLDADQVARSLVRPGSPALRAIVEEFGDSVLDASGVLDRARLRRIVLDSPELRGLLEGILHPWVRRELLTQIQGLVAPYCIVSIPLLIEAGMVDLVDRVLVVDLPEGLQYQRAVARGGLSGAEVDAIMAAQARRGERLAVADEVIMNDGSYDRLHGQVDELHEKYTRLAKQRP
jgi:dephospho-CoA kinase